MNFDLLQFAKPYLLGLLRHAAGGWAIWLVNRGYLAGDGVQTFTGAVLFLGTVGFSIADKITVAMIKAQFENLLKPNAPPSTVT